MSQDIEKYIEKAGAWNALVRIMRETKKQQWVRDASGERVLEFIGGFVEDWEWDINMKHLKVDVDTAEFDPDRIEEVNL